MSLEVSSEHFWKERIERAKREGNYHYSVYLVNKRLWEEIAASHEAVLKEVTKGKHVLDAGCGYGRASEWVDDYTGIDSSPDFIKEAQKNYPKKHFEQADLTDLSRFKDQEFDLAFCISIRQMIRANLGEDEWDKMAKELKRVAKKVLILEYEDHHFQEYL